jgi:hypothetical protein
VQAGASEIFGLDRRPDTADNPRMARKRISTQVRAHYRRIGRKGGRARALKLTARERSQIARLGAEATNAKWREKQAKETA